jgi:hypothetical protein
MAAEASRPAEGATAALAREPGEAADLLAVHRALRLAEVATSRATRALLDAQRFTVEMIAVAREAGPSDARTAGGSPPPAARSRQDFDIAAKPDAGPAQARNAGTIPSVIGEAACRL